MVCMESLANAMPCNGFMGLKAELFLNRSLIHLGSKGMLGYDVKRMKEMPNCACQRDFIKKTMTNITKEVMLLFIKI